MVALMNVAQAAEQGGQTKIYGGSALSLFEPVGPFAKHSTNVSRSGPQTVKIVSGITCGIRDFSLSAHFLLYGD